MNWFGGGRELTSILAPYVVSEVLRRWGRAGEGPVKVYGVRRREGMIEGTREIQSQIAKSQDGDY